jgi:23S rRNA (cytidine1920-2'-O)/16S rRNA (cytidine1409-2'-O)-methyltransferase
LSTTKRRELNLPRKRLDMLVMDRGLATSRERAKALIMAGDVYVDNQKADKPGDLYPEEAHVECRSSGLRYVSRGGLKLEKAIAAFGIELCGLTCMDIGASTGGFTDCMLQNGAKRVYSVDVGYGQLAWQLRNDSRVVNLERTNARYLSREQVPEDIGFFSVDVSFISLALVLPAIRKLLSGKGRGVCLIKPQFEAGREKVGKKGVVREPAVHMDVIEKITGFAINNGFSVLGLDFSPVKGPEGNIEYLILLERSDSPELCAGVPKAKEVVTASHASLDK